MYKLTEFFINVRECVKLKCLDFERLFKYIRVAQREKFDFCTHTERVCIDFLSIESYTKLSIQKTIEKRKQKKINCGKTIASKHLDICHSSHSMTFDVSSNIISNFDDNNNNNLTFNYVFKSSLTRHKFKFYTQTSILTSLLLSFILILHSTTNFTIHHGFLSTNIISEHTIDTANGSHNYKLTKPAEPANETNSKKVDGYPESDGSVCHQAGETETKPRLCFARNSRTPKQYCSADTKAELSEACQGNCSVVYARLADAVGGRGSLTGSLRDIPVPDVY